MYDQVVDLCLNSVNAEDYNIGEEIERLLLLGADEEEDTLNRNNK